MKKVEIPDTVRPQLQSYVSQTNLPKGHRRHCCLYVRLFSQNYFGSVTGVRAFINIITEDILH